MLLVRFWFSSNVDCIQVFMLLALGTWTYPGSSPVVALTMEVALMPLGIVWTQVPLISCSTCSVKLPFFQKAAAFIVIVNLACRNGGRGICELNIRANTPSPLLPQSSVQKQKGGHIFGSLWYVYWVQIHEDCSSNNNMLALMPSNFGSIKNPYYTSTT